MKTTTMRHRQHGLSLIGLLFYGMVIGVVLVVGMKVFPTYMEFLAIQRAVDKASNGNTTILDVQKAFDRYAAIDDIVSIAGKDLDVVKNGDKMAVGFAYEKRIPLVGPASLLLDYKGGSRR